MSVDVHLLGALPAAEVSSLARSTAAALIAGLWQGMVLCAAAGVILKLLPKSTATLRFTVWAAVFAVSVAMPFVNLPVGAVAGRAGSVNDSNVMLDMRWSYVLAGLWFAAAAYRLGQLAVQGFGLRMLWLTAAPISGKALEDLTVPLFAAGREVALCTSDEVDRPSVIGFFAPRILIPAWLFEQLTAVELNHIVLHELEHLRRRDDWVNLLQKMGLVLLPLNPALFWIDRRLSTERELACDDGVLDRTNMPRAYAKSLASIAERRLKVRRHGRFGALALAATGLRRRSELGERIESILGRRAPVNRALAGGLAAVFVAGVVGAGAGLAHAPRLVSFGPKAAGRQAALVGQDAMATHMASTAIASGATNSRAVSAAAGPSLAGSPVAKFQDVSFREPRRVRTGNAKATLRKPAPVAKVEGAWQDSVVAPRQQRFVVLTSWDDSPVSRVVVQTPDGKFFLTPYAAVPTQAGWLLVQL